MHGKENVDVKPNKIIQNSTSRKGAYFDKFVEEGYAGEMLLGDITAKEVADIFKISSAQVSRMYSAYIEDEETKTRREDWTTPKEAIKSLKTKNHSFKHKQKCGTEMLSVEHIRTVNK